MGDYRRVALKKEDREGRGTHLGHILDMVQFLVSHVLNSLEGVGGRRRLTLVMSSVLLLARDWKPLSDAMIGLIVIGINQE